MSNLLSTSAMVTQCQSRLNIGLSSAFWMSKLNEAYRWISQKGNFVWTVKTTPISILVGTATFSLPALCDPGKPMYLSGPWSAIEDPSVDMSTTIPYVPWDVMLDQQMAEVIAPPGMFSCWSFSTAFSVGPPPTYGYQGLLYPLSAMPTPATGSMFLNLVYHVDVNATEYASATNIYFPTPNSFDNLLIELAEAEAKRIYGIAGWDIVQKRAESAIVNLLDSYRSTKNVLAGLTDQQKQVSEKKMMAQENS